MIGLAVAFGLAFSVQMTLLVMQWQDLKRSQKMLKEARDRYHEKYR